jgi:xanthine dehydrogenase accessory factor
LKLQPVASEAELLQEANRLIEEGKAFAWVTIIGQEGSSSRHLGSSMLVTAEGRVIGTVGGAVAELQLIDQAVQAIKEGKPRSVKMPLPVCAGVITCFINVFQPHETLILAGAGHVAQPMAKLGKLLGFRVIVVDDRAEYATKERFPEADKLIVDDWEKALREIPIDEHTYVIILTHGGESDELALRTVVGSSAAYVGMISSVSKAKAILGKLRRDKFPEEQLRRVVTPIGLDIGAETPAEIAVSTMAQIVMQRKKATGKPLSIAERETAKTS